MSYQVIIPKPVQKQLAGLPLHVHNRVLQQLTELKENPRPQGYVKLKGYENEYRIRVGNYRIRYEIREQEEIVLVLQCRHRKDIYRGR